MKILLIKSSPEEIDISKNTYNNQQIGLAYALIKAGHKCSIMCCADVTPHTSVIHTSHGDINLYAVRAVNFLKNGIFIGADKILRSYDIIQCGEYNQLFSWYLARKYPKKTIIWHGTYFNSFNHKYNLLCKIFDPLILPSYKRLNTPFITKSDLAADYLRNKGLKNVNTVGVGLFTESFNTEKKIGENIEAFLNMIAALNTKYKLLYVGRLEERRNCLFLLDVLKQLRETSIDAGLVIVGKGNKNYCDAFWNRANELGLRKYIAAQNEVSQPSLSNVYKSCDLFLLPTLYEIFGMVILEAMFYGVPVVTTINGGSVTLINDGIDGMICNVSNSFIWADRIGELLQNELYRMKMGILAVDKIVVRFTWDSLADIFIKNYNKLSGNNICDMKFK